MRVLRFLTLFVTALWIGGLVALGAVAAPAVFTVLQNNLGANGLVLGGETFGAILRQFEHWTWGFAAVQIGLLALRAAMGPRPRRVGLQILLIAIMGGLTAYDALVVAPAIGRIQRQTAGPITMLPADDIRRTTFNHLHATSTTFMVLVLAGATGLLWIESRD